MPSRSPGGLHPARAGARLAVSLVALASAALLAPQPAQARNTEPASGCALAPGALREKAELEQNLLPKVRFVGEPFRGRALAERMNALGVPGLSLALIHRGRIAWTQGYGVGVRGGTEPVTCQTLFQAASLSKPVTVLAVMRLHEAGLVDLDTDIQTYLRAYRLPAGEHGSDDPVTFRNILTHTSGLSPGGYRGYRQNEGFPTDLEVLLGTGVTHSPRLEAPNAPGTLLAYSGGGYTVAELAMQDLTGEPFEVLMEQWALAPAGMTHSDFAQPLPAARHGEAARAHDADGNPVEGGWHNHPEQAAAGLWSTAEDLARFMLELYRAYHGESEILGRESMRQLIAERRDGHAYGFLVEDRGQGSLSIRHYGGNVGYRSFMMIDLETGDGAAYLTNSDRGGDLGEELMHGASRVYQWHDYRQIEATRLPRAAESLRAFVGVYAFESDVRVRVDYRASEQAIGIIFPNGDRYSLVPIAGQDEFIHAESGVTVSFGERDAVRTLTVYGGTATQVE